jgi:hypothetical protein
MAQEAVKKNGLVEVVSRALIDSEFRNKVLSNPEAVAAEQGLSSGDTFALKNMNTLLLEEAASRLNAAGDAAIGIGVGVAGRFAVPNPE